METSKKQTSLFGTEKSTSLPGDSLANPTQVQEKDLEKKMNAIYGQKCLEQLDKLNHVGLWAKMFSGLLLGMTGWYSKKCKLTWKLKGTKYNRIYFQLQASTLPISEIEFGLLPTAVASDVEGGTSHPRQIKMKNNRWVRVSDNTGTEFGAKLRDVAQMLPTPVARDYKGPQANEYKKARGEETNMKMASLPGLVGAIGKDSQLNPQFVAEMMGFPTDWTELPFQNGEKNQSKDMETQ